MRMEREPVAEQTGTTKLLPIHKEIIDFIDNQENCLLGDVVKGLSLSFKSGFEYINFLKRNKLITDQEKMPFYTVVKPKPKE